MSTTLDHLKFAEIMATIGAAFSKPLTETQLDIYYGCLADYSIEQLEYAARYILRNRTITGVFPLISEFVAAIETQGGTIGDRAEIAWLTLRWAIESVGLYESVMFEDQLIHQTVKALGGWIHIAGADDPDWADIKKLEWRKKDFVRLYSILAKNQYLHEIPYLVGLIEAENAAVYPDFIPKVQLIEGSPGHLQVREIERLQLTGPHEATPVDEAIKRLVDDFGF